MRFIWPFEDHIVTRDFSFRDALYLGGQHAALDLVRKTRATRGSPILAVADGIMVAFPGNDRLSGYNAYIDHGDGWRSGYRHFIEQNAPACVPIPVKQGQVIAHAGSTGASTGDHLHFDLWNKRRLSPDAFFKAGWWAHDPALYLRNEPAEEDDMAREILELTAVHGYTFILTGDGTLRWLKSQNERDYLLAHGFTQRTETDDRAMDLLDTENGVSIRQNLANQRYG